MEKIANEWWQELGDFPIPLPAHCYFAIDETTVFLVTRTFLINSRDEIPDRVADGSLVRTDHRVGFQD